MPETTPSPYAKWTIDELLHSLPTYATVVSRKFPDGVSDDVLQAWSDGIHDVVSHMKQIIAEWRRANGQ